MAAMTSVANQEYETLLLLFNKISNITSMIKHIERLSSIVTVALKNTHSESEAKTSLISPSLSQICLQITITSVLYKE